jgi:hypothetical protein
LNVQQYTVKLLDSNSYDNGDYKETRKTFRSGREPYPFLIARFRHSSSSYKSPQNSTYPRTTSSKTARETYCPTYSATASDLTSTRLSHIHKEAQPHTCVFGTPGFSNLHWQALRFRMERRRAGGKSSGGGSEKLEEK